MTSMTLPAVLNGVSGAYLAGSWQEGEGPALEVLNPSSEETLLTLPTVSPAQAEAALVAARKAQPGWVALTGHQRAQYLLRIAEQIEANVAELSTLLALEVGKPLAQGEGELLFASETLRYQAGWARRITGEIVPSDDPNESIHLERVPVGVVAAITAWNFPMAMFFRKIAPALITGNTVVLKPSETTPLAALALMRLIERVELPPGVLNIVVGAGDIGSALVRSPTADMVTMTGSMAAGKAVMRDAAEHLTKVSLELGGKAAAIVWSDADLDVAVPALVMARHLNSGQVCTCAERIYVHEQIMDEFLERYTSAVSALRVGDPSGEVDMGPMVSAMQREKVAGMVDEALAAGAKRVVGDSAALDAAPGYWYPPTVLVGVDHSMPLMRQEVFGPVSPVMPVRSLDEALALANDSSYGLSGYIFSRSYQVIMRVARQMACGELYVNRTLGEAIQGHHSGHKQSGLGGEDGRHGMLRYTEIRAVYHHLGLPEEVSNGGAI